MKRERKPGGTTRTMFRVAWVFLLVTAAVGVLLRAKAVLPLEGVDYSHLLHTHSHVAFLGWVHDAFFALACVLFVSKERMRGYVRLFAWTQLAVVGMLVTFPLQGYARESIAFSTLHMVAAFVFVVRLWKEPGGSPAARGFLRAALVFVVLSGLGPLALGPLAATGHGGSVWYHLSIYWYLHLQYDGWFVFFLLAAGLQALARAGVDLDALAARRALGWLAGGCFFGYALSTLWMEPHWTLYVVAGAAGGAQLVGAVSLARAVGHPGWRVLARLPAFERRLLVLALGALALKFALQFAGAFPVLATFAFGSRHMAIAFLHLVFLGFATPALLAAARICGWMRTTRVASVGVVVFVVSAALGEALLLPPSFALLAGWTMPTSLPWWFLAAALGTAGGLSLATSAVLGGDSFRRPTATTR
ncbi:hypothetical protein ASA1KI_31580 [Opitutales bacterium ASA1]|uniref:hypothetical protein n=1 Tax=Congregicoccus parvus TaxID=3081749 RepID=UPI002B2ED622|nr:hypothetical protein ASA1KI_31580 [Opitutales bacterium ASA1]